MSSVPFELRVNQAPDIIRESCPLCSGKKLDRVRDLSVGVRAYTAVRCIDCTFVFIRQVYGGTESGGSTPAAPPIKPRHRQILSLIRARSVRDRLDIVEVGAGWGGLGYLVTQESSLSYLGFEPSYTRAQFCAHRGINVRNEGLTERTVGVSADVAILDNVLEHVLEPANLLKLCRSILRPGGFLIVIVPNLKDVRGYIPSWRYRHLWQPHCHINYFTGRTLRAALRASGFMPSPFPFSALSGRSDLPFIPRVALDNVGVHLMGLNYIGDAV